MGLENADFIPEMVDTNPTGTDPKSEGDDHLNLIKRCVQNSFPAFVGTQASPAVVGYTEDELSDAALNTVAEVIAGAWQFNDLDALAKKTGFRNPTAIAAGVTRDLAQNDEGRILLATTVSAIYTAVTLEAFTTIRMIVSVTGVTLIPDAGVTINFIDGGAVVQPAVSGIDIGGNSVIEIVYQDAVTVQVFGNGISVI